MMFGCCPYLKRISISSDGSLFALSIICHKREIHRADTDTSTPPPCYAVRCKGAWGQAVNNLPLSFSVVVYVINKIKWGGFSVHHLHWILHSRDSLKTSSADRGRSLTHFLLQLVNIAEGHIATEMLHGEHKKTCWHSYTVREQLVPYTSCRFEAFKRRIMPARLLHPTNFIYGLKYSYTWMWLSF